MLKRFIAYYRPHRLMFALDMLASLLIAALAMAYPIITREMLNVYIPSGNIDMIGFMAFLLLVLYILRMLLKYFVQYYGEKYRDRITQRINDAAICFVGKLGGWIKPSDSLRTYYNNKKKKCQI